MSDRRSLLGAQVTQVVRVTINQRNSLNHGFYDVCEAELKHHSDSGCNLMVMTMYCCLLWSKALTLTVRFVSHISVRILKCRDIEPNITAISDTGPLTFHCSLTVSCAVNRKSENKFIHNSKNKENELAITRRDCTSARSIFLNTSDISH